MSAKLNTPPGTARIIANFGAAVAVRRHHRDRIERAVPAGRLPPVVAGDRVQVEPLPGHGLRAVRRLPRESVLERADRRGVRRALAANLTHLAIVNASRPGFDTLLIDQFCIAAHRAGIQPLIVINKSDLLDEQAHAQLEQWLAVYRRIGYETVVMSTRGTDALEPLVGALQGRVLALVGASGVGKSSIVDRLLPEREIRIGELSAATGLGAHTTSVTCWYDIDAQAAMIDSPGVREYSVAHLDAADIRAGYSDIDRAAAGCRFGNCSHRVEPGCAVIEQCRQGRIADFRYGNYLKLLAQAEDG